MLTPQLCTVRWAVKSEIYILTGTAFLPGPVKCCNLRKKTKQFEKILEFHEDVYKSKFCVVFSYLLPVILGGSKNMVVEDPENMNSKILAMFCR